MSTAENIKVGDLVVSGSGHDKNEYFIVVSTDKEFVYLCNGKSRKADKPKRKKRKHVIKTGMVCEWVKENPERVNNTSVRKAISGLRDK